MGSVDGAGRGVESHAATTFLRGRPRGPLAGHDHALDEQLATPDTPRLATLLGAGEAGLTDRAGPAERLGVLDVGRGLGEEDLRVVGPAGDGYAEVLDLVVERGERAARWVLRRRCGRGDRLGTRYGRGVRLRVARWCLPRLSVRPVGRSWSVPGRVVPRPLRPVLYGQTEGPRIPGLGFRGPEGADLIRNQAGSLQGSSPRKARILRSCCVRAADSPFALSIRSPAPMAAGTCLDVPCRICRRCLGRSLADDSGHDPSPRRHRWRAAWSRGTAGSRRRAGRESRPGDRSRWS